MGKEQTLAQLIPKMKSSSGELQRASSEVKIIDSGNGAEVSAYFDSEAEPREIAIAMARLKAAFPKQNPEFFNMLSERIIANGFTSKRLEDAVNKAIDGFQYKELNVSDIIRHDRRTRLYTYIEVCNMVDSGYSFDDFEMREVNGRKFWIQKKPY